jgi:pyrroloquinoline quinone biosynthesis protein B
MKVRVLGSAAGGGFPQWNCGCSNCRKCRQGDDQFQSRTQESLAIAGNDENWVMINASPDIHAQINSFPKLWPKQNRHTPISAIVLTNGDMDHILGLFSLRESQPLKIYATESVRRGLTEGNSLFRTLERFPGQVTWVNLEIDVEQSLGSGLNVRAIPIAGKRPVHLEGVSQSPFFAEDNIGLLIREENNQKTLGYFPAVAGPSHSIRKGIESSDLAFFDGTFWSQNELSEAGTGTLAAREMAHWPVGGSDGSLAFLSEFHSTRCIFTHINNTNPLLCNDSPQNMLVQSQGLEVAYDGMEFTI